MMARKKILRWAELGGGREHVTRSPDPSDASPVDRIPGQNYVTPSSHIITPQTSHLHHDAAAPQRESVCVCHSVTSYYYPTISIPDPVKAM
jgi:hypothetical protein